MVSQNGTQIIYSCVDLMVVFVPLVTHPFLNVKGPHLGCIKIHHVETEKNMSLREHIDHSFRGSKFRVSICKLCGMAS